MRIAPSDLYTISKEMGEDFFLLKDASIFITGGTGFIGKWLLESIIHANENIQLNAAITVLTRDSKLFRNQYPHIAQHDKITFVDGDIRDFKFPENHYNFIIHAATDADAKLNAENPLLMLETTTEGTKRVLEFAKKQPKLKAFLFTSSGAVYGKQPEDITHTKETDSFHIDINAPTSAYAEGKRIAELYCSIYSKQYNIPVKIARCFAFVGPYLPINKHFAIGNFISDVLSNNDIIIKGDGTPLRSYMYASDLVIWLISILIKGEVNVPYNVGSDYAISIEDLALLFQKVHENKNDVKILGQKLNQPREQYVPDISKGKHSLHLEISVGLEDAIRKTIAFHQLNNLVSL